MHCTTWNNTINSASVYCIVIVFCCHCHVLFLCTFLYLESVVFCRFHEHTRACARTFIVVLSCNISVFNFDHDHDIFSLVR